LTSNPLSDCRPEGVIRRGFTRAFHQGIKLPEIPKNDLISGITVNSLNTFVPEGVQLQPWRPGRNQKSWIFGGKGASAPLKLIPFYENRKNGAETFRTAPNWPQLATVSATMATIGHNGHKAHAPTAHLHPLSPLTMAWAIANCLRPLQPPTIITSTLSCK
jgi:hypothetical protein